LAKSAQRPRTARPAALPSEEQVLEFIQSQSSRVGKREIARAFGIRGAARIDLKKLLKQMSDKGLIERRRKRVSHASGLPPVAVLEITAIDTDGDPLARPASWDEELSGPPPVVLVVGTARGVPKSLTAGIGDRVLARISRASPDAADGHAYEARIIRRLDSRPVRAFGIFHRLRDGTGRVEQVDKRARNDILISPGDEAGAEDGELVSVELHRGRALGLPHGRIVERFADAGEGKSLSLIAIHEHGIPFEFPADVLAEARALSQVGLQGRTDLRDVALITIDPSDARDHDDAVWAREIAKDGETAGWEIIVAIADVGAYVKPGGALDREARKRGNSVYFPDRVVPMLPERLSSDLCSLVEGAERPALAVTMTFDKSGNRQDYRFDRVMMKSAARLSYAQAQAAIDGKPDDITGPLLEGVLEPLWGAFQALGAAREARQPLDLDLPDRRILLDDAGHMTGVYVPERLDAHKLIEAFMIEANVCAAELLKARRAPIIHRFHDLPSDEKITALADFLKTLNLKITHKGAMRPHHFNRLLAQARERDLEHLLSQVILRTQAQAVYSASLSGHFGLNLPAYVHFTSPIRRYSDLMIHRVLNDALGFAGYGLGAMTPDALEQTAVHISATERRAAAAERDTADRMTAAFLLEHISGVFQGRVSGVIRAGLFVTLDDTGADGFVPAATLEQDYFMYDEKRRALVGRNSGETFTLGDKVTVRLAEARPAAGALRFEITSKGRKGKPVKRHPGAGRPDRGPRRPARRRRR